MADEDLGPSIPLATFFVFKFGVIGGPTALLLVQPQGAQAKTFFDVDHPRSSDVDYA